MNGGESTSRNHSPKISRSTNNQSEPSSLKGHLPTALPTIVTSNGTGHKKFDENDEEVRSKPRRRYVSSSVASVSTSGVKTIADILNSADEQLKVSQEFADRLAIRRSVAHYRLFVNTVVFLSCIIYYYVCVLHIIR